MIPFKFLLYATSVYALPYVGNDITIPEGKVPLLWTSIGATSFGQGVIVTIVTIAEDQGMWTFHFRIARYEHRFVSVMLSTWCSPSSLETAAIRLASSPSPQPLLSPSFAMPSPLGEVVSTPNSVGCRGQVRAAFHPSFAAMD